MRRGHQRRRGDDRVVGYRGAVLGPAELAWIQRQVDEQRQRTRQELAVTVCKHFGWRRPGGSYAVDSVRMLLARWAEQGRLRLPGARRGQPARRRELEVGDDHLRVGWSAELSAQDRLVVRPITARERPRWRALMRRYHYLGDGGAIGETMRYVALQGGEPVALLCWAAAARYNGPRDRYVGWDAATRAQRLFLVANNVRFLILPWARRPHLASQVLAANLRRLSRDWEEVYGHPIVLAETFVDTSRFRGTCYRASNWVYVGQTKGWSKSGRVYRFHGQPKAVWLYPLRRDFREQLCMPQGRCKQKERFMVVDMEKLPLDGKGGLLEILRQIPDPRKRRGIRHQMQCILATAVGAVLAGARFFRAIAEWAAEQPKETLQRLGSRRGKAPSERTYRRVLESIDVEELGRRVGKWVADQTQLMPGMGLAVDGKTARGSADGDHAALHLLSAIVHGSGTVIAQVAVESKTNEITNVQPLLQDLNITGVVVTADALLTQREIARHIVEDKKADYVFTVKDNQPTLRKDIEDLFKAEEEEAKRLHSAQKRPPQEAFPPSAQND